MIFLGLDLSLTGTGISLIEDSGISLYSKTCTNKLRGTSRLIYIRDQVDEALSIAEALQPGEVRVSIEGYAYGATGKAFDIGELGGVVRVLLAEHQVEPLIVTPQAVKKWATGMGRGGKVPVGVALYKQFGLEFSDDNTADAFILAWIAKHYYTDSIPEELQTKYREEVINNLKIVNGTFESKLIPIPHSKKQLGRKK